MSEACGKENIFIFGLTADEVEQLWKDGYQSTRYYTNNERLRKVIEALTAGFNRANRLRISRRIC